MKKELLKYIAGLCQAAAAAFLVAALIVPELSRQSLLFFAITAVVGAAVTVLKELGE